jgi:hypothetical protein
VFRHDLHFGPGLAPLSFQRSCLSLPTRVRPAPCGQGCRSSRRVWPRSPRRRSSPPSPTPYPACRSGSRPRKRCRHRGPLRRRLEQGIAYHVPFDQN